MPILLQGAQRRFQRRNLFIKLTLQISIFEDSVGYLFERLCTRRNSIEHCPDTISPLFELFLIDLARRHCVGSGQILTVPELLKVAICILQEICHLADVISDTQAAAVKVAAGVRALFVSRSWV